MEPGPDASTRIASHERDAAVVRLDGVDVMIEGTRVLHGLDWRLDAGTHWGVTGANGSGKSTFLALVAGSRWPAPGSGKRRFNFGNGPERDAVSARRRIALVGHELQDRYTKLEWNFRATDVVISGLHRTDVPRLTPTRADELEARRLLRELGLDSLAERAFLELSRGEQRRVLIARALAFRPRVLLLDEPASGLDAAARAALDTLLTRVAASAQIVVAAHAPGDLPRIVTHVLELDGGRIRRARPADGARDEVAGAVRRAPRATAPARDGTALIEVRDATVWLGGRRALDRVSWRLERGQHWLVTGPNGAGKSTLLKLVHGQLRPARGGSVAWPGLGAPRDVWTLRRRIGWVSPELQAGYVYRASVAECIGSGFTASLGRVRAPTAAEHARVAELVRAFELEALEARPLTSLSYGQLRRVLIARALAPAPQVLLLDEPWEGLDADTSALVATQLRAARDAGTQLVCASHLGDYGLELDHALELERGAVTRLGTRTPNDDDAAGAFRGSSSSGQPRARDFRAR